MEYEYKEFEAKEPSAIATIRSALEKIYVEIDHLEEFNRTTGLSQVCWQTNIKLSFAFMINDLSQFFPGFNLSLHQSILPT